MGDKARPHVVNCVREYLEARDIQCMRLPARSQELNPTERLWDELGRAIHRSCNHPEASVDLKTALVHRMEWIKRKFQTKSGVSRRE